VTAEVDIDWRAFADAIFAPPLPNLAPVLATARELARERISGMRMVGRARQDIEARTRALCDAPFLAEAWETLCGRHGGGEIFDRSTRGLVSFAPFLPLRDGVVAPRPMSSSVSHVPRDLETMVSLLAAPPEHVLTAEAVAMEFAREIEQWHGARPSSVIWGPVSERWAGRPYDSITNIASDTVRGAFVFARQGERAMYRAMRVPMDQTTARSVAAAPGGDGKDRARSEAALDAADWLRWRGVPRDRQRHGADLFDAVLNLWGLGYVQLDTLGESVLLGVPIETGRASPSLAALRREAARRYGEAL